MKSTGGKKEHSDHNLLLGLLTEAVRRAIAIGYTYIDFIGILHWITIELIEKGHIFTDYLEVREEIEDETNSFHSKERWEQLIEEAFRRKGVDYNELIRERCEHGKNTRAALAAYLEHGDDPATAPVPEILKKALAANFGQPT